MFIRAGTCLIVVVSLILGTLKVSSLQCEDGRCKTGLCNSTGACICNLPDPSTVLDGDRPFLGGKFCDEEMAMCDGTNSFWCEHGGTCEEIVQGEKYTCKCPQGFTGEHCEHSGEPCGQNFCFHKAECLAETEGHVCQCPPNWKGSLDCSLPTKPPTDSYSNSTTSQLPQVRCSDTNRTLAVLVVSSVGAVAAGAIYGKKLFSKKKKDAFKFQRLSQLRTHGGMGDDEEDVENESMELRRVHDDNSHL